VSTPTIKSVIVRAGPGPTTSSVCQNLLIANSVNISHVLECNSCLKYRYLQASRHKMMYIHIFWGMQWCNWLRHIVTNQKVTSSTPNVIIFF
jgi:hypothetical protein